MIYCFDLDGVVCATNGTDYKNAKPVKSVIKKINHLYNSGHIILIYTGRGMGTLKGNLKKVHDTWYKVTKNQLKSWGLCYHQLILGKPPADIYIDDKAMNLNHWIKSHKKNNK